MLYAAHRYLQATAALIQSGSSNSMQPKLLHLIAWLPAHRFGSFSMSLAVFAWHWICAESPHLQVRFPSCSIPPCWLLTSIDFLMAGMYHVASSDIACGNFDYYLISVLLEPQASPSNEDYKQLHVLPQVQVCKADVIGACPSKMFTAERSHSHFQSLSCALTMGCSC